MANFNEHALEMTIMQLFKDEGYTYVSGDQIPRESVVSLSADVADEVLKKAVEDHD